MVQNRGPGFKLLIGYTLDGFVIYPFFTFEQSHLIGLVFIQYAERKHPPVFDQIVGAAFLLYPHGDQAGLERHLGDPRGDHPVDTVTRPAPQEIDPIGQETETVCFRGGDHYFS